MATKMQIGGWYGGKQWNGTSLGAPGQITVGNGKSGGGGSASGSSGGGGGGYSTPAPPPPPPIRPNQKTNIWGQQDQSLPQLPVQMLMQNTRPTSTIQQIMSNFKTNFGTINNPIKSTPTVPSTVNPSLIAKLTKNPTSQVAGSNSSKSSNPINDLASNLSASLKKQGIYSPAVLAYGMGTAMHETDKFNTMDEYGNDDYFNQRYGPQTKVGKDLGNINEGDGALYHGRGPIQVTGRNNYAAAGKALGVGDLFVQNPELVNDPRYQTDIVADYFKRNGTANAVNNGDILGARQTINPDDKGQLISDYTNDFLNQIKSGTLGVDSSEPQQTGQTDQSQALLDRLSKYVDKQTPDQIKAASDAYQAKQPDYMRDVYQPQQDKQDKLDKQLQGIRKTSGTDVLMAYLNKRDQGGDQQSAGYVNPGDNTKTGNSQSIDQSVVEKNISDLRKQWQDIVNTKSTEQRASDKQTIAKRLAYGQKNKVTSESKDVVEERRRRKKVLGQDDTGNYA